MRKALEEDQYSANGSIVDTESDDDELQSSYKGQPVRLDRSYLVQAARKHLWLERNASGSGGSAPAVGSGATGAGIKDTSSADGDDADSRPSRGNKKKKKGKRGKDDERVASPKPGQTDGVSANVIAASSSSGDNDFERDEGSIFGQTTGSSNSTWVECDKCKKVGRILILIFHGGTTTVSDANNVNLIFGLNFSVATSPGCGGRTQIASQVVLLNEQE